MTTRVTAAVLISLALARAAAAQPRQAEVATGPGVKVSDGTVLHPSIGARSGYVSNVFYQDKDPVAAGILYVNGGLHLATLPPERRDDDSEPSAVPKLEFRLGADLRYQEYLTSNQAAKQQRDLGAGADLEFVGLPYGPLRFELDDHFVRYIRPKNFETNGKVNRDVNDGHVALVIQPGGHMLQLTAAYENTIDRFESRRDEFANRLQQRARLRLDWTFLPYTKTFLEGSLGFFGGLGSSKKVPSMPLRILTGLDTAITPTITIRAHAGYAQGFYSSGADYVSPVGGLDFGWEYRPMGRIELGYQFDFRDSINANFYAEHMARFAISQGIRRSVVTAYANGYLRSYRGIPAMLMPTNGATSRNDVIGDVGADVSFYLSHWLVLSVAYQLGVVSSDVVYDFMGTSDDPGFIRHDATVGLEVRY